MLWGAAAVEGKGAAMFDAELGGRRKININMLPQLLGKQSLPKT